MVINYHYVLRRLSPVYWYDFLPLAVALQLGIDLGIDLGIELCGACLTYVVHVYCMSIACLWVIIQIVYLSIDSMSD
jgi:hypothetical protein